MNTTNVESSEPVAGPVERPVRPVAEARWYCLDRDGVAMLCKDEEDARAQAVENDDCWPGRAPHRAVLLGDVGHLLDGGDLIQLAQPRNEHAMRTAELCLSAWATARMDTLEQQLAAHKPLVIAVRNVLEEGQMYAEDLTLLRLALQQVERANG